MNLIKNTSQQVLTYYKDNILKDKIDYYLKNRYK
jgi:hypothetical protein